MNYCYICNEETSWTWVCEFCVKEGLLWQGIPWTDYRPRKNPDDPAFNPKVPRLDLALQVDEGL